MPIRTEHHRSPRPLFVAGIELTELETEKHLAAHTRNLNLIGCYVETLTPLPEGAKVRLRISHGGRTFVAQGRVAYSRPNSGMGIAFTMIEPRSQEVLDKWLATLRA